MLPAGHEYLGHWTAQRNEKTRPEPIARELKNIKQILEV